MRALPLTLFLLLALGGCSGVDLPLPGSGPSVEIQEGAAPSATLDSTTLRADQVTREGDTVGLGLTIGKVSDFGGDDLEITSDGFSVTTSSGVQIPASFEDRTIPANQVATVSLSVPLSEASVTSLLIKPTWNGPEITVPIPAEDASWAWQPAPLRQVGLAALPTRSDEQETTLDAIASSGFITEVSYHVQGFGLNVGRACSFGLLDEASDACTLTESNGTVHPLIHGDNPPGPDQARSSGTLRFLGELDPDGTDLTLLLDDGAYDTRSVTVSLPSHADSSTVPAAGTLARPAISMDPVTLKGSGGTAKVTVDAVDVFRDNIQVHVTATGNDDSDYYLTSDYRASSDAGITEPSGAYHPLMEPTTNDLVVKAGGTLEATLVFAGSVPADVTSLDLLLGDRGYAQDPVAGTLTIEPASGAEPPASATLGEVEETADAAAPAITATPVPLTQDPSASADAEAAVTITAASMEALPLSSVTVMGPVLSSVEGTSSGADVASAAEVDPAADAEAQRTLEDMGAEKTPEGWVLTLPETVLFDYNKADILPAANDKLTEVADLLNYFDTAQIAVQGHTDSDGDAAANMDLSLRRAQAVADALAADGVTASRMEVEGFGETEPIASNATDEGKQKNRRVEIVLADKS